MICVKENKYYFVNRENSSYVFFDNDKEDCYEFFNYFCDIKKNMRA